MSARRSPAPTALAVATLLACARPPEPPPASPRAQPSTAEAPPGAVRVPVTVGYSGTPWPRTVLVTCSEREREARQYACAIYAPGVGTPLLTDLYRLAQGTPDGSLPAPPAPHGTAVPPSPAPTPSVLRLRKFDGHALYLEPPWLLVPVHLGPLRADPPATPTGLLGSAARSTAT